MQNTRLATIVEILLKEEKSTAPSLSEKLEVSRRTINRDIDILIKSGIPIVTSQGIGGGIYLDKKKAVLESNITTKAVQEILSVIRENDIQNGTDNYSGLMKLFEREENGIVYGNPGIVFDASNEEDETITKIKLLSEAIEERLAVEFVYYAGKDAEKKTIVPYHVVYRKGNWYVWGKANEKEENKLFKLNRIEELSITSEKFSNIEVAIKDMPKEKEATDTITVKALFDQDMKNRLIEEKGINSFEETSDGRLLYEEKASSDKSIIRWILTFGPKVEIVEPVAMRERLKRIAINIANIYK